MLKNIIFCFSSIHPQGFSKTQIIDRENNYNLSIEWLLKIIPKNWDIVYNENTLESINDLANTSLKDKLSNVNIILHKNNEGQTNKGAGEHDMCRRCFNSIDYTQYNWIVYFTARHIIPNSWYFDNLEKDFQSFDAVMSNPKFFYLNYMQTDFTKNLYNDMIFSMKSLTFKKFVDSINVDKLKHLHKSSENHLYDFINENNINKKEINYLGILRNDHQSHGWHLI